MEDVYLVDVPQILLVRLYVDPTFPIIILTFVSIMFLFYILVLNSYKVVLLSHGINSGFSPTLYKKEWMVDLGVHQ